jgi:hypothetical protein
MSVPFVYFKVPETDTVVLADITSMLNAGETLVNIVLGAPNPTSADPLVATLTTPVTTSAMQVLLQGGNDGTSYGVVATVTTTARVFLVTLAVTAADPQFIPYTTSNPSAFQDLVDEIEAGKACIGTAIFAFPPQLSPVGGFVTWEMLAADGTVYAAGNAFEYKVIQNGISNVAQAKAVINIPATVPPSLDGQRYQLRYTLELPQATGTPVDPTTGSQGQNVFYQFEGIRVVGLNTVPIGTQPSVEIQGAPATLSLVVAQPWDNVTIEIWSGGQQIIAPVAIQQYERVANGWYYAGVIDTSQFSVTLVPYSVVWRYWASTNTAMVYQERADLYIVNPSIMSAVNDVKAKINKARTTLYGHPDLLYPESTIMTWLRRGADAFNIAYGQFTSFTFTNALGGIREFWLLEAELAALQSQYLAEGEKAFNFQGAQISLDVDRTQFLDNAESKIQSRLDNELKLIKQNLIIKGNTSGDGSADPSKLQPGAIAAVGITITPASMWGAYAPGYFPRFSG